MCGINDSIDKRTNGYFRRKEAISKGTDMVLELLNQAQADLVLDSYLLFDSWFAYPAVIKKVRELNLNTICMLKPIPTIKYEYQGQKLTLDQLYSVVKKKRGRATTLASIVSVLVRFQMMKQYSQDYYCQGSARPQEMVGSTYHRF